MVNHKINERSYSRGQLFAAGVMDEVLDSLGYAA